MPLIISPLDRQATFVFQFFPAEFEDEVVVNWEAQNVTSGKKPLYYTNTDPGLLRFEELYLDNTDSMTSVKSTLATLKSYCVDEQEGRGSPSSLLIQWGDETFVGVLTRMTRRRTYFDRQGNALRVKLSLEFKEIQENSEAVNLVNVT